MSTTKDENIAICLSHGNPQAIRIFKKLMQEDYTDSEGAKAGISNMALTIPLDNNGAHISSLS
jgi:hypothetical protein